MSPAAPLHELLRDPRLWRGDSVAPVRAQTTGHAALDAVLPGGGWPQAALSEVLYPHAGVGELSLVLPLLVRTSRAGRPVILACPEHLPYAPAFAAAGVALARLLVLEPPPGTGSHSETDALWACEQMLHAGAGTVLLWSSDPDATALRRLQLAAESGDGICILFRRATVRARNQNSIAALRLQVTRTQGQPRVEVLKCRGARPAGRYAVGSG